MSFLPLLLAYLWGVTCTALVLLPALLRLRKLEQTVSLGPPTDQTLWTIETRPDERRMNLLVPDLGSEKYDESAGRTPVTTLPLRHCPRPSAALPTAVRRSPGPGSKALSTGRGCERSSGRPTCGSTASSSGSATSRRRRRLVGRTTSRQGDSSGRTRP